MSGAMAVAHWAAHVPNGWSRAGAMGLIPYNNNGNLAILYGFFFLYVTFASGGAWSTDALRRGRSSARPSAIR